jgi:LysM repeat protein
MEEHEYQGVHGEMPSVESFSIRTEPHHGNNQMAALNQIAAVTFAKYIRRMPLHVEGLDIACDVASETVTVSAPEPESQVDTLVKGDNLSKISRAFYGAPNKHPRVFEANKSLRTYSYKSYPGQVLRTFQA